MLCDETEEPVQTITYVVHQAQAMPTNRMDSQKWKKSLTLKVPLNMP